MNNTTQNFKKLNIILINVKGSPLGDLGVNEVVPTFKSSSCFTSMIRKLKSGEYRLYSRKKNPKTGKRRNLGTFKTRAAAEKHEKEVQYFKRQG
jgi:hypothetical protein